MPNMHDVAKLAGVSVATVSNYINGTKPIKPGTRLKISEAIEQLNFQPNANARNLKMNQSSEIGLVLPNINDSYYIDIFKGIEKAFQKENHYVNVAFSNEIPDNEKRLLDSFLRKNISGAIVITCQPNNYRYFYDNFISKNIPIVFVDRKVNLLDTNFICFNNKKVIHYLTTRLIDSGYKNIGLMVGPREYSCESECIDGFKKAFHDKSISANDNLISYTGLSKEDAFRSAISLLQYNEIDALITSSESISKGVLEAACLRGILIPDDLLVITLGQEHWNNLSNFTGTFNTARPALNMGEEVAKLLQKNMQSPMLFEPESLVLDDKILFKEIDFTRRSSKNSAAAGKCESINVLMLECQTSNAIRSLLPSFTNTTSIEVNFKTSQQQFLQNRIISDSQKESEEIDVYMFDIPWLPNLAYNGYLADISGYMNNPEFDKSIFINDSFKYYSEFGGKYYGVPFLYAPQLLFYRKDLFTDKNLCLEFEKKYKTQLKPPRTWLEFNAIAEFFTISLNPDSPVEYGTSVASAYQELIIPEFLIRLWSYGGRIFNNSNRVVFNSPESAKAMTAFCKTFEFTDCVSLSHDVEKTVSDFYEGKTAMMIGFSPYSTEINSRYKSKIVGKIGYDYVPGRTPILGGWSLGIGPNSKKKDAAFKFINWACGKDICNYCAILEGQSTLIDAYSNDELLKLYPWLTLLLDTFKYCKIRRGPFIPGGKVIPQDKIEFIVSRALYAVLKKDSSVEEALRLSQHELEQLFNDYGYKQL